MATITLTCTADVSISQAMPSNVWNSVDSLAFGQYSKDNVWCALLNFQSLNLSSSEYKIDSAVLTVTKYARGFGMSNNVDFFARATRVTSSWDETTTWSTAPSTTNSGESPSVSVGDGTDGVIEFDVTNILKAWQSGSSQYGIRLEPAVSYSEKKMMSITDCTRDNPAYITVTYSENTGEPDEPDEPDNPDTPTTVEAPTVNAPGVITGDTAIFTWSSTEANAFYHVQVSLDAGNSWSDIWTVDDGSTSITVDIRALTGVDASVSYYNEYLQVRVRAGVSDGSGGYLYSSWSESEYGTVDYRTATGAPGSLTIEPTVAYEGQMVTVTVTRPEEVATSGSIVYHVLFADGTPLAVIPSTTDVESVSATVKVPNVTRARSDLSTTVYSYCIDAEGKKSPSAPVVAMNVLRYRAPVIAVETVRTAPSTAEIVVTVTDTGYSEQFVEDLSEFSYSLDNWETANSVVNYTWTNFKETFIVDDLPDSMCDISVRVLNRRPIDGEGNTIPGLDGDPVYIEYVTTIMSYIPAAFVYRDRVNGVEGLAAKSLIVGDDLDHDPVPGDAYIQGYLSVGGGIIGSSTLLWEGTLNYDSEIKFPRDTLYSRYTFQVCPHANAPWQTITVLDALITTSESGERYQVVGYVSSSSSWSYINVLVRKDGSYIYVSVPEPSEGYVAKIYGHI